MIPSAPPTEYTDYQKQFQEDDSIPIKRYLSLFLSNWYWFAFSLLIAISLAYGINRYSDKVYVVSSTLLIKDQQNANGISNIESLIPGAAYFSSRQNLKNEIGILKSFYLNLLVMDSLPEFRIDYYGVGKRNIVQSRLYTRCPFKVISDSGQILVPSRKDISVKILSKQRYLLQIDGKSNITDSVDFGRQYKKNDCNFMLVLRDPAREFDHKASNKYFFRYVPQAALANEYRNKLDISPIDKDATVVTLSVTGPVQEQEADYLNTLMNIYIKQGLINKGQTAQNTITFIDSQLVRISDSLKRAEFALRKFRLSKKMVDISKEGAVIQSKLDEFESSKRSLELKQTYYIYLQKYLDSKNETGDIISPAIMGVDNADLERLILDLSSLQKERLKLMLNLYDNQPPVTLSDEKILRTKLAIKENISSSLDNLESSMKKADENLGQINIEIEKLPQTEIELINIQRRFDLNNTVYTFLLEKKAEAGINKASNVPDSKVIDYANVFNSYMISPRTSKNYLRALLLALMIPGILITLLYYFNNRIIDNSDIMARTAAPVIGYISHSDSRHEIPVVEKPGSSLSESFRAVRTTLKYFINDNDHPVISVTSTISAEGKTFISVNLAAITAMLGKKVLLVGLDLRRPRIHKILSMENDEGLSTFLSDNCRFEEVIKETNLPNLFFATSGPVPPNPAELINGENMKIFIEKAREQFDFIIIDTPPLAVVADTLLLAEYSDINLFIVRQRYSSRNTLELIQELYSSKKLKNMGIVVNDISLTGYYGYGLRYGYYKGYGYTYGKNYYGEYTYGRYGYDDKAYGYYKS